VKDVPVRKAAKTLPLKTLKEAQAKNPDDLELTARLAERYLQLGRRKEAAELADRVLQKERNHAAAIYVKARVLIDNNDEDLAFTLLENGTGDDTKDARPLKLLGNLQFKTMKYNAAARTFERCRKLEPFDTSWLVQLAKVYLKTEDREKMLDVFKEVVKVDPDDLVPRKRLAKHFLDANNMAEAERYARMALEIDVLERDCQTYLLQALDAQGKDGEAKELRAIFGR
jgi:predicted Zn-dependent protease